MWSTMTSPPLPKLRLTLVQIFKHLHRIHRYPRQTFQNIFHPHLLLFGQQTYPASSDLRKKIQVEATVPQILLCIKKQSEEMLRISHNLNLKKIQTNKICYIQFPQIFLMTFWQSSCNNK